MDGNTAIRIAQIRLMGIQLVMKDRTVDAEVVRRKCNDLGTWLLELEDDSPAAGQAVHDVLGSELDEVIGQLRELRDDEYVKVQFRRVVVRHRGLPIARLTFGLHVLYCPMGPWVYWDHDDREVPAWVAASIAGAVDRGELVGTLEDGVWSWEVKYVDL